MLRLHLFLLFALSGLLSAGETLIREVIDPKSDTHIEVVSLFTGASPGGFQPVRVTIVNNLKTSRRARLEFESKSAYWGSNTTSARSSFGFDVAPGTSVTRDLLVPLVPPQTNSYTNASLQVVLSGSMGDGMGSLTNSFDPTRAAVLMSDELYTPNGSTLNAHIASGPSYFGSSAEFAARFDPKQLPDEWLAFSGFDSMLMLDGDWSAVPSASRHAILSWVRMGGKLVIYAETAATSAELGLPEEAGLGEIVLKRISSRTIDPADTLAIVTKLPGDTTRQHALSQHFLAGWPLQKVFGAQSFRYGLFIVVLIIFGIVVGPVNLFVFAKSGQRHRLFITTPLISLVASILLVALIILQDGFGGSGFRLVHMEVRPDDGLNSAYIHQEQFARTGVLTSNRFTLESPAVVTPVPIEPSRWARYTQNESKGAFSLQPAGSELIASGDWFQSRSEHGHYVEAVVPTRGRIERTESAASCLSTFDFPILALFYLDDAGQWHRATEIQPGKRFNLEPVDTLLAGSFVNTQASQFIERDRKRINQLAERPGHFIAVSEAAPGIDTHPGIRWHKTTTVLTGPIIAP